MRPLFLSRRPGVTFIEVLLFIAIISIVGVIIFPLLFTFTENRLLQETISLVEGNGDQILQILSRESRHAERILYPAEGQSGSVLLMQTASGSTNPTLFGANSGSLIVVYRSVRESVSASQVAVSDFSVTNTSITPDRPSYYVSFVVTRTIRLAAPHRYTKRFSTIINAYPADIPQGEICTCAMPGCENTDRFAWQSYTFSPCSCQTHWTYVTCF